LKKAGVAFSVFPDYAIAQLEKLQFTKIRVIGTQFNECGGRDFVGEKVAIAFLEDINPREPTKTARWVTVEGKKLGIIDARSPNLLAGCEAIASITSSPSTSVIITSLKNPENKLQIDRVNQYACANHNWQGEQTSITFDVQETNPQKASVVFTKIVNQVLGVLNKQSVDFLTKKLAAKGRSIQGLTIRGTVNKAPPNYADIIIDPNSVKFPEYETSNIATVAIINGTVDPKFQAKTEQVMCNMLKRAIARAVKSGFDTIEFVDVSPNPTPPIGTTLKEIAGVQSANSVRQMLARLRETVDRHIWVRNCGIGFIGNHSTSMGVLLASQHSATRTNIALLSQADNADYSIDENFQTESLQTWAKRACVINAQMRCYREFVLQGLVEDGYRVIDAENIGKEEGDRVFESVKDASQEL
jgi:hypothetical protein